MEMTNDALKPCTSNMAQKSIMEIPGFYVSQHYKHGACVKLQGNSFTTSLPVGNLKAQCSLV
jgi:hypothetical protein